MQHSGASNLKLHSELRPKLHPCICVNNIRDDDPETGQKVHCSMCNGTGNIKSKRAYMTTAKQSKAIKIETNNIPLNQLGSAQFCLELAAKNLRNKMNAFIKAKEEMEIADSEYHKSKATLTAVLGEVMTDTKVLPLGSK